MPTVASRPPLPPGSKASLAAAAVARDNDLQGTPRRQRPPPVAVKPSPYVGLQDPPSPSGRLADRIERLRQRCIEALGTHAFRDAYEYLQAHDEVSHI